MWIIYALLAALTSAVVVTLSKAGLKNVPPGLAFAIEAVLSVLVAVATVLWQGLLPAVSRIDGKSWLFLVGAGILGAVSSLLAFQALSTGDASRVSPTTSTTLVFSIILAAIFLKEKLTWQVVAGATLMVSGLLFIILGKPAEKADGDKESKKDGRPASGATIYNTKPAAKA